MAIPISVLVRLQALERSTKTESDTLVFEDGYTARGSLFDAIKSFTEGGPQGPHGKIVGLQTAEGEDGLWQAIFRAVKDSATAE